MWFTDGSETNPDTAGGPGRPGAHALARAARRAARCRRGGAQSVEFSMIAVGLFTLMLSGAEMAWQGMTAMALENGALHGSRAGSMGRLMPDGTRAGQACPSEILAAVRRGGAGLLNGGGLTLETSHFGNSRSAGLNQGGNTGAGLGGQTAVYTLAYEQPFLVAGKFIGLNRHVHRAVITVRNEPFANGAANAQPCS